MAATTGVAWIWLLLLGGGGMPIPLSLPPLPEDPVMSSVAPEECLWYLTWSGSAKADTASKNKTEQLLAEEEIQRFGSELEHRLVAAIASMHAAPRRLPLRSSEVGPSRHAHAAGGHVRRRSQNQGAVQRPADIHGGFDHQPCPSGRRRERLVGSTRRVVATAHRGRQMAAAAVAQ